MVATHFRSKDIQKHFDKAKKLFALPTSEEKKNYIHELLQDIKSSKNIVEIDSFVIQDAQVNDWIRCLPFLEGTQDWLSMMIHRPTYSIEELVNRQTCIYKLSETSSKCPAIWNDIKNTESDVLWSLHLPNLYSSWPLPLLFPKWFFIRWINNSPIILELYHFYRVFVMPFTQILYPIGLLLAPYWYIRTKLKWSIPFSMYTSIVKKGIREILKLDLENPRQAIAKVMTLCMYLGMYLYTLFQTVDISVMVYQIRKQLKQRLMNIHSFIENAKKLWDYNSDTSAFIMHTWGLPEKMQAIPLSKSFQGVYDLFQGKYIHELKTLVKQVYVLDAMHSISSKCMTSTNNYCFVEWLSDQSRHTELHGMGHPMLSSQQRRNPCNLSKNIIVTGPNAAGKSTYVRSILTNYILGQTFGISYARKAFIYPVEIISSFMRVQDEIGTRSLFEAECQRCKLLLDKCTNDHKRPTLLFLDEPMHATPPIEGTATAMALLKQVSSIPHVRVLITTHYHPITSMQYLYPNTFINVSMDAKVRDNRIIFDYTLKKGPSFQSIAIEMLERDLFPKSFIQDAIEFKNKICRVENK